MSRPGKDSPEVVKFMTLFSRLKDWTGDEPERLAKDAAEDESIRDLCADLYLAAYALQANERRRRSLFAAPVDPAFVHDWRDYEGRYEAAVAVSWLPLPFVEEGENTSNKKPADIRWENADDEAEEQSRGISRAVDWARSEVENDLLDDADFLRVLDEGVAAWDRLVSDHGLDLRGVFRRRALIPFVLVPRMVAAKHGAADKLSMLKNLQQAHDTFVFGAPYAAIALMRSVMEAVLRDHYGADGKDLKDRIHNVRTRLPPGVHAAALDRLRTLANAVLHLDGERDEGLSKTDDVRLEQEIVRLLFVIRSLIEGAK